LTNNYAYKYNELTTPTEQGFVIILTTASWKKYNLGRSV